MNAINLACSPCSGVLWQDRPSARQKENVLTVFVCILIKPPPIPCQSKGKEICVRWIDRVELRVVSWYDIGGHGSRCGYGKDQARIYRTMHFSFFFFLVRSAARVADSKTSRTP